MSVSSHVLDATTGQPADDLALSLWRLAGDQWTLVAAGRTDSGGRAGGWEPGTGTHRLVFDTGQWWQERGKAAFHPEVVVAFTVTDPQAHHHVPLLLSPFSYTTYRGS